MVNSLPCQVKVMSSHLINTPLGQVGVTPCNPEGIEPFTLVNSLPGQVGAVSLHPINTLSGQVRVTPCNSEGIEPFTTVNSLPCQVRVTPCNPRGIEPFTLVNSLPGKVGAVSLHLINTLSGPHKVSSSVSSRVPASISPSVT